MRKLVGPAILAASTMLATGCFFVSDDDDDGDGGGDGTAFFDVSWDLDPGCPPGSTTAQVVSQRVDSSGNAIGAPVEDLFDCEDSSGTTRALPLGDYDVTVNITDESTDELFAQSDIAETDLIEDGEVVPVDFTILTAEAFFALTWTIDGADASVEECEAVGGDSVSVLATLAGSSDADDTIFDCEDGEGTTDPLVLGDYVIDTNVVDTSGGLPGVVVVSGEDAFEDTLEVGNEVRDLGAFDFVP